MDIISHLLSVTPVRGSLDIRCQFGPAWQIEQSNAPEQVMQYHIVLKGQAQLDVEGVSSHQLFEGDIVMFPAGQAHKLYDGNPALKAETIQLGAGGITIITNDSHYSVEILCGRFTLPRLSYRLISNYLPTTVVLHTDITKNEAVTDDAIRLHKLIQLMHEETADQKAGSKIILDHLSGALFGLVIRNTYHKPAQEPGLLKLSQNSRLKPALMAILDQPEQTFSLPQLASLCFMSRTTFVRQFQQAMGKTAAEFILEIRMLKAAKSLEETDLSVDAVAEQSGYQSVAAFQRIFKEVTGLSPALWRKQLQKT